MYNTPPPDKSPDSSFYPNSDETSAHVWLDKITLSDFRNYKSLSIKLGAGPVVLSGDNGSGKTNLLEAVSMFMPGRGLRRAANEALPRIGCSAGWSAGIRVNGPSGSLRLGTGRRPEANGNGARIVRVDGVNMSGPGVFSQYLRLVWLTPAMDGLFGGPASERRRFFDRIVTTADPAHSRRLSAFERAMRERNKLLEGSSPDPAWLAALERQMALSGTAVAAARRESAARLNALMAPGAMAAIEALFPWAQIDIAGVLENSLDMHAAVEVEDIYRTMLCDSRKIDAAAGRTLEGPHRADMQVMHAGKEMAAKLCSTGEQKAVLIAIILAQTRMISQSRDSAGPVLLLDEVAAHLDAQRRNNLFATLLNMQVQAFMTGTDKNLFSRLENEALFLNVKDGAVWS